VCGKIRLVPPTERIGRYRISGRLGSGAFSVYLQIKQPDGEDWAPRILGSVEVHPERAEG
jgi:hypothetical protein